MSGQQWINYHHLYYFKTIAEENSVSKAAQKLRLGQPTLSAQLKQFESQLGVTLFERQHKKLVLTEHGKKALQYAQSIFKMGSEMVEVLQDKILPHRTHLQVGALDSIPKQIILNLVQHAQKQEECLLSLVEGRFEELIRELAAFRLDLVLTNSSPLHRETPQLQYRQISRKTVSIYGAPRFKKLQKEFPYSLQGQPFLFSTYDSKNRADLEHWLSAHHISVDIVAETQDIGLKKLMAEQGLGLMATSDGSVERQLQAGHLVHIGPAAGVYEELYLVTAKRKLAHPLAQHLMKTWRL